MVSKSQARKQARKIVNAQPGQIVHHIDGNPFNNDPANLLLLSSYNEHAELHSRLGKPPTWNGRKHSDETRQKMSASQRKRYGGHELPEETKRKISKIRKMQCAEKKPDNPMLGRKMSEAHKQKISEAMKQYHARRRRNLY